MKKNLYNRINMYKFASENAYLFFRLDLWGSAEPNTAGWRSWQRAGVIARRSEIRVLYPQLVLRLKDQAGKTCHSG